MAKAKKTAAAGSDTSAAAPTPVKAAAKKGGKSKAAEKQKTKAAAPAGPVFNIALAANAAAAAKSVAHRAKGGDQASAGAGDQKDSNSFKDFKQSIQKPSSQPMGGSLSSLLGSRPSNLPFGGNKQVAHNQTFGNLNSKGVPRRTNG